MVWDVCPRGGGRPGADAPHDDVVTAAAPGPPPTDYHWRRGNARRRTEAVARRAGGGGLESPRPAPAPTHNHSPTTTTTATNNDNNNSNSNNTTSAQANRAAPRGTRSGLALTAERTRTEERATAAERRCCRPHRPALGSIQPPGRTPPNGLHSLAAAQTRGAHDPAARQSKHPPGRRGKHTPRGSHPPPRGQLCAKSN